MFEAKASLKVKVGNREYDLICSHDSPIVELLEVVKIMQSNVQKMKDDLEAKEKSDKEPSKIEPITGVEGNHG